MFHLCTVYLSSTIILLMGTFLLMIKVPAKEEWYYLKISRIFIFITYTLLALVGSASILYEYEHGRIPDRRLIILSVSFVQAMLFTFTAIAFIRPKYLTRRCVMLHVAAILPFVLLNVVSSVIHQKVHPTALIISASAYALQLGYYVYLFLREYQKGIRLVEEHFDQEYKFRLQWIQRFFFSSLAIGVMALAFSLFKPEAVWFDVFTIVYTVFYIYVIGRFKYYLSSCGYLVTIVAASDAVASGCVAKESPAKKMVSHQVEEAIQQWIKEEQYLVSDVSIDEIADALHVSHDELNEWSSAHHNVLFRTWRMQLRIQKAQQLLQSQADIRISELQTMCGFSDKSHFLRQFKNITGLTPTEYRKKFSRSAD